MKSIIQLKITLQESNPLIWRRVLLTAESSFFELHHIIQIAMGWKNYHLYEFNIEGYRIGEISQDEKTEGYGSDQLLDSKTVKLTDIITEDNEAFTYEYDFGDRWLHLIEVEHFSEAEESKWYPICIDGQYACPPEDCGGIDSYYEYLTILKDKTHPDYKDLMDWFPRRFDPEKFDRSKTVTPLRNLDLYISKWLNGR